MAIRPYTLLEQDLIYTGITRARKFLVVVGQGTALGMAVRKDQSHKRYSGLLNRMMNASESVTA
jgi:exodeoxyribonuclease V alpha subunit